MSTLRDTFNPCTYYIFDECYITIRQLFFRLNNILYLHLDTRYETNTCRANIIYDNNFYLRK